MTIIANINFANYFETDNCNNGTKNNVNDFEHFDVPNLYQFIKVGNTCILLVIQIFSYYYKYTIDYNILYLWVKQTDIKQ